MSPSCQAFATPPSSGAASNKLTLFPCWARRSASVMPRNPPPTTAQSSVRAIIWSASTQQSTLERWGELLHNSLFNLIRESAGFTDDLSLIRDNRVLKPHQRLTAAANIS